jgi:hypothetical protein
MCLARAAVRSVTAMVGASQRPSVRSLAVGSSASGECVRSLVSIAIAAASAVSRRSIQRHLIA